MKHFFPPSLTLSLLILVSLFPFISCQKLCEEYERVPRSFDSISYLGSTSEFHDQATVRMDLERKVDGTNFTLSVESHVRFYVAPNEIDVDMFLYQFDTPTGTVLLKTSSLDVGTEEVIFGTFPPGKYRIQFNYFGVVDIQQCGLMVTEFAIIPKDRVAERHKNKQCFQVPPSSPYEVHISVNSTGFQSTIWNHSIDTRSSSDKRDVVFFPIAHLILPSTRPFKLEAKLGYDFVTGGSLGLVLSTLSNLTSLACFKQRNCTIGTNLFFNHNILRGALLTSDTHYYIYVYDVLSEKIDVTPSCTNFQFSFTVTPTNKANWIECDAIQIPRSLNGPGMLDQDGHLYFSEKVLLDLPKTINFTVNQPSFFRASVPYLSIDIDISLIVNDTSIAYSARFGRDVIAAWLNPGVMYTLKIFRFPWPAVTLQPCDSFLLEIAISPFSSSSRNEICTPTQPSAPTLSEGSSFQLMGATNVSSQAPFFSCYVVVNETSNIYVDIDTDFLFGDIDVVLESNHTTFSSVIRLEEDPHKRNKINFAKQLIPGAYNLLFSNGKFPSNFTICTKYAIKIFVEEIESDSLYCDQITLLPSQLSGVKVHVEENFFIPRSISRQEVAFHVNETSFLRVNTRAAPMATVQFFLKSLDTNISLAHPISNGDVMTILKTLQPHTNYALIFEFPSRDDQQPCQVFHMQLSIAPQASKPPQTPSCGSQDLGTSLNQFFVNATATTFVHNFFITKHGNSSVPFSVSVPTNFKVLVNADFLWSDIVLILVINATGQSKMFHPIHSDRVELPTMLLPPGNYVLQISDHDQVSQRTQFLDNTCIPFTLTVLKQTHAPEDILSCYEPSLPSSLNIIPFLSETNNYTLHLRAQMAVQGYVAPGPISFEIKLRSIIKLFIPVHRFIDVDFTLLRMGSVLASFTNGVNSEEAMLVDLDPGNYTLKFYYLKPYSVVASNFTCARFSMELSIVPFSYYQNQPLLSLPCSSTFPTNLTVNGKWSREVYAFQMGAGHPPFRHSVSFHIPFPSEILLHLRYKFMFGSLSLSIKQVKLFSPTIVASYGYNHAFLAQKLSPGNYTLEFHDPFPPIPGISCSPYAINYRIRPSSSRFLCEKFSELPTNLYDENGGSSDVGGPQDPSSGNVLIQGRFLATGDERKQNKLVNFTIVKPSVARFFIKTEDLGTDIDFTVQKNGEAVFFSSSWGNYENEYSPFTPGNYTLNLHYFSLLKDDCNYFNLQISIMTNETLEEEVLCPSPLPSPLLPPTEVAVESHTQLIIQQEFANVNPRAFFSHFISINVETSSIIFVQVGFNFLTDNYHIFLWDTPNTTNVLKAGDWESYSGVSPLFNFRAFFEYPVGQGTYYLEIREDFLFPLPSSTECSRFFLYLSVTPTGSGNGTAGAIVSVDPPSGNDLNPNLGLLFEIGLSKPLSSPSSSQIEGFVTANQSIFLVENPGGRRILPEWVYLESEHKIISVSFPSASLKYSRYYDLMIVASHFIASDGTQFVGDGQSHQYSMLPLDCHGHGAISFVENEPTCVCQPPWSGLYCDTCQAGYHYAGTQCVENVKCTPNTCNSHGFCDDDLGYPVCTCYTSWVTVGNDFCSACASGYVLDGHSCKPVSETGSGCTSQLLPRSLDGPSFLGFNSSVHLAGAYYIDFKHGSHPMEFTLEKESLLRVYAEPHWVDVDLWLEMQKENDFVTVANSITFHKEEVIFRNLKPGKYRITFRYYSLKAVGCEEFYLELAISPVQKALQEIPEFYKTGCSSNLLPAIVSTASSPVSIGSAGYKFKETDNSGNPTLYHAMSPNALKQANPLFEIYFTIDEVKNKTAFIHAELHYRFLTGDLSFELKKTNSTCTSWNTETGNCILGRNMLNRQLLEVVLIPGSYTLRIYEPTSQLANYTKCAPFEFSMEVFYFDKEVSSVDCPDAATLPQTLNVPGLLDSGTVHLVDNFRVDFDHTSSVSFTLEQTSRLRLSVSTISLDSITLWNASAVVASAELVTAEKYSLHATLPPGRYRIIFSPFPWFFPTPEQTCLTMNTELSITIPTLFHTLCPSRKQNVLPSLPEIRSPFNFNGTDFLVFLQNTSTTQIASYPIVVTSASKLRVRIDGDFANADLVVALRSVGKPTIVGKNTYNSNQLRVVLEPGGYTLDILVPIHDPTIEKRCTYFDFSLRLSEVSNSDCNFEFLENPPKSLNTNRFLKTSKSINFQSTNFKFPVFDVFAVHNIAISVVTRSLFRIYVDPHDVDIDLFLFNSSQNGENRVKEAKNGFNGEESLTAILEPNQNYTLRLLFFKWKNVPRCSTFKMQFSLDRVPKPAPLCIHGGNHLPPSFKSPPFRYSSIDSHETLYYQQQTNVSSFPFDFKLTSPADFHAEVGYVFLTGDLTLQLFALEAGVNSTNITFFGENHFDRTILHLRHLKPGSYRLIISESAVNPPEVLGCSNFTFFVDIQNSIPDLLNVVGLTTFPDSLNSVAYLRFTGRTHIQDNFMLFPLEHSHDLKFTVSEPSVISVRALARFGVIGLKLWNVNSPTQLIVNDLSSTRATIAAGSYNLNFAIEEGYVYISQVELAIDRRADVDAIISQSFSGCIPHASDPITFQPPYFHLNEEQHLILPETNISINLTEAATIFINLGFNLILDNINFMLTDSMHNEYPGFIGMNSQTLEETLPPDVYMLTLYNNKSVETPHCRLASLTLIIRNQTSDRIDCSHLELLPVDLNTWFDGEDDAEISGTNFHYVENMHLNFEVHQASALSILVSANDGWMFPVITVKNSTETISEIASRHIKTQSTIQIYYLNPGKYDLLVSMPSAKTCPSMTFQFLLKSYLQVERELLCPEVMQMVLPSGKIQVDVNGATVEQSSGVIPSSWNYDDLNMTLIVKTPSIVNARIDFNPFAGFMSLAAETHLDWWWSFTQTAADVQPMDVFSNRALYLTAKLNRLLLAGNYTIQIHRSKFQSIPLVEPLRPHCSSFRWHLQVTPTTFAPRVESVDPPFVDGLRAGRWWTFDLVIKLNTKPYQKNQVPVDNSGSGIIKAFSLVGKHQNPLAPSSAVPLTDAMTSWRLEFPSSTLQSSESYSLHLAPDTLFDSNGHSFQLPFATYTYSTAHETCNNNGDFVRGVCICSKGYTGPECEICDVGYINVDPEGPSVICTPLNSSSICRSDSCGCLYVIPKTHTCVSPLGQCIESSGSLVCHCAQGYAGEHCERCSDGYFGYPRCRKVIPCNQKCTHGTCDYSRGVCQCDTNWDGAGCEQCKDGYGGNNCDEAKESTSGFGGSNWKYTVVIMKVTGIVLGVVLFVALLGFGLFWYLRRRRNQAQNWSSSLDFNMSRSRVHNPDDGDEDEEGDYGGDHKAEDHRVMARMHDTPPTTTTHTATQEQTEGKNNLIDI